MRSILQRTKTSGLEDESVPLSDWLNSDQGKPKPEFSSVQADIAPSLRQEPTCLEYAGASWWGLSHELRLAAPELVRPVTTHGVFSPQRIKRTNALRYLTPRTASIQAKPQGRLCFDT
jgi:hypothetical protein